MVVLWRLATMADLQEQQPLDRLSELRPVWLALAGTILLGALVIYIVDRWRKRPSTGRPESGDQLTHFRVLYERGELSREEYERIRARLGQRLRQELKVPGKPSEEPPPSEPAGEPPSSGPPDTGIRPG